MLDFSNISKNTTIGFLLRLPLRLIPHNTVVYIVQGILKGNKWVKGSGVNSYWLGNYEKEQQILFTKNIKEGDVIFDVGSNVGFYSLIASKMTGKKGRVYAFEPAPRNLYYLKKHLELNNCTNSIIVSGGVSDKTDVVYFNDGDHFATGSLSRDSSNMLVPTFNLDGLIENKKIIAPNVMKIDVEGAEFDVLNGVKNTLIKYHPIIFLSTHNEQVHQKCLELLHSLDYKLSSLDNTMNLDKAGLILAI